MGILIIIILVLWGILGLVFANKIIDFDHYEIKRKWKRHLILLINGPIVWLLLIFMLTEELFDKIKNGKIEKIKAKIIEWAEK